MDLQYSYIMNRLIEGVFSKIMGLASLKYFKSGMHYISSASPTRTTGFYVNQDFLNDHHVSLDIFTFKETTTGRIQDYQLRRPQTKTKWMAVFR